MTTDLTTQSTADPAVTNSGGDEPPLLRMSRTTQTRLWNDSATLSELSQAIGWGAVGATCNPVIALAALRSDLPRWQRRIARVRRGAPDRRRESDIGWAMVRELSVEAAALLDDAFTEHGGPQRPALGPDRPAALPRR